MALSVGKSGKVIHNAFIINRMAHCTPGQSCKQSKIRSMYLGRTEQRGVKFHMPS